jgi:hypothetical protein
MSEPLPAEVRTFDLSRESSRLTRRRFGWIAGCIGLAAVVGALGASLLLPPWRPSWDNWGLAGIFWGIAGLLVLIGLARQRGAPLRALTISRNGLSLTFSDGTTREMGWIDPKFGLTLRDYSNDPNSTDGEKEHVWMLMPERHFGSIPPEVAQVLIQESKVHSLPIAVAQEASFEGRVVHIALTTRIGRLEQTPGYQQRNVSERPPVNDF